MRSRLRQLLRNRKGSVLAFVAVFMPATLGTMALAIDLSMLFQARLQAQRAADSAALAAVSAYLDFSPAILATQPAQDRAYEYALMNNIKGVGIDSSEVTVQVRPAEFRVYVHVRRENIPTWFARFLGFPVGDVAADAVAEAVNAGGVNCLRPLAVSGHWHDADNDANGNRVWDYDEDWEWDPAQGDYYAPFVDNGDAGPDGLPGTADDIEETGWGSDHRDVSAPPHIGDAGRTVVLKQPNGNSGFQPGWFQPLRLDGNNGANDYENSLKCSCADPDCNPGTYFLGDSIDEENGAMIGPTADAIIDVVGQDPNAFWDQGTGTIQDVDPQFGEWRNSPRVWLLALFSPFEIPYMGGDNWVNPTDFAYFFLEGFLEDDGSVCTVDIPQCTNNPVVGRFLYYATGLGSPGPETGALVKQIRLVE